MQRTSIASAVIQQEVGNRDRLRLVERLLTVASARVHERGIGRPPSRAARRSSRASPPRSASASRRARGGTAPSPRRRCRARCTGRSPSRFQVHVGAGVDQQRQHRRVLRGDVRGTLAELEHRIVDPPAGRAARRGAAVRGDVAATDRVAERLDVALLRGSPRASATSRNPPPRATRELRIRELSGRVACRRPSEPPGCARAPPRRRHARREADPWRACAAVRDWCGARRLGVDTDDLLQKAPVSASWAEERSVLQRRPRP